MFPIHSQNIRGMKNNFKGNKKETINRIQLSRVYYPIMSVLYNIQHEDDLRKASDGEVQ